MKTTVIHHSADYDGIFSREIARKFLPDAELIGWNFPDKPLPFHAEKTIYVIDLPVDRVFGWDFSKAKPDTLENVIWIDHHKSSIETHPTQLAGYRIDGVAACRLAWQWFSHIQEEGSLSKMPTDIQFKNREVMEPLAVRLAGEYDVFDLRDPGAVPFQFGLDAQAGLDWGLLLESDSYTNYKPSNYCSDLVRDGAAAMRCYAKRDADVMRTLSFLIVWEGIKFLGLNTPRCNSNTFAALDKPETGHDALMAFGWDGRQFNVSLYHAAHNKGLDLSIIAKKHGGGGHAGACGFRAHKLEFLP